MKAAIVFVLILLLACSCSLSQFSYWGERGERVTIYDEYGDERALEEAAATERDRAGEKVAVQRAKLGLPRCAMCPRCHRPVPLSVEAKQGDEVRCGNCGKAFALDLRPGAQTPGL